MPRSRAQQSKSASLSFTFRFFAIVYGLTAERARKWRVMMHGSFLCLVCIIWHDMNLFLSLMPACQLWKGFVFFYIELCIVIFVFLPGSEHVKVRLYKGVVVNPLHVKNLSARHNRSRVINEHDYFQCISSVTLIQVLNIYGKYVTSNLWHHCSTVYCVGIPLKLLVLLSWLFLWRSSEL